MDILHDLEDRLKALGFNDPKIEKVVMEVRTDWRGERPYIGVKFEADRKINQRNILIIRDFKAGERITFLARRYGLSRKRIWEIIKG